MKVYPSETSFDNLYDQAKLSHTKRANPIKLTFENLEYEVVVKLNPVDTKKLGKSTASQKIIKGATGYALPGQTLYMMGSSGAGKTSLLNIVSDRINQSNGSKLTGKVTLNDSTNLDSKTFGAVGSYVM